MVIKGRNKGHAVFFVEMFGCYSTIVVCIAYQFDFNVIFSKHLCLVDLLHWGDDRHEYDAFYTELFATIRKTLRMIAGTGTYNTLLQLLFGQAAHHIVCATQLVGTYNLQIFPL